MPKKIKNIIFDFGQVLVPLNIHQMIEYFNQLSTQPSKTLFESDEVKALWKRFDNSLDAETFRLEMKIKLNIPAETPDEKFDEAWNTMVGHLPDDRIDALKLLRQHGIRLFMFSNNNHIHHPYIVKQYGPTLNDCFEKQYFSNLINMAKPHPDGYCLIINENNLDPEETLFVDDRLENVEGAKAVGLHALQFVFPAPMSDILNHIEILNRATEEKSVTTDNNIATHSDAAVSLSQSQNTIFSNSSTAMKVQYQLDPDEPAVVTFRHEL